MQLIILIIVIIAVIAIVQWFAKSSGIAIPQPVWIVIYAAIAIMAIVFLFQFINQPNRMILW